MDDGDGDDGRLDKWVVERDSSDAGPLALPHVAAVDLDMTTTTRRNPGWCSLNHSPRRLSLWWNHSREERHPSGSKSLEAAYWTTRLSRQLGNSQRMMKNMAPLQSVGNSALKVSPGRMKLTRDYRRTKIGGDDGDDDFLDRRIRS